MNTSLIDYRFTFARKKPKKEVKPYESIDAELLYSDIDFQGVVELYRGGLVKENDLFSATANKTGLYSSSAASIIVDRRSREHRQPHSGIGDILVGEVRQLIPLIESFEVKHLGTSVAARLHLLFSSVFAIMAMIVGLATVFGVGAAVSAPGSPYKFVYACNDDSNKLMLGLFGKHVSVLTWSVICFAVVCGGSRAAYYLLHGEIRYGDRELMSKVGGFGGWFFNTCAVCYFFWLITVYRFYRLVNLDGWFS